MNAPTLEVLNIQMEQVERQVQEIRRHLETHQFTAKTDTRGHLEHAVANCFGIETLALHVHACVTCAHKYESKALPVCAGDGAAIDRPEPKCSVCRGTGADPLSDSGNNSLPCQACRGTGKPQPVCALDGMSDAERAYEDGRVDANGRALSDIPPAIDQVTGKGIPW